MSSSSSPHVEPLTSSENWLLNEWKENNEEGLTNYVLITANRLQKGKTSLGIRIGETVEEYLGIPFPMDWDPAKPTDFSKSNLGFDPLWYMERMDNVPEFSILVGDEWNRAMGQRKWFTQGNQDFAEVLQTTAYQHIHGLFPLPHQALTDNAIVGICTTHIIVESKGYASVYSYDRDQLNRAFKQRTPHLGDLTFKKPSAKRWHTYQKMREAYTGARKQLLKDRIRKAIEEAAVAEAAPDREELLETILKSPDAYKSKSGRVSAVKIASKNKGVAWNRAVIIADQANARLDSDKS
jgi:hypothetical protein